MVHRIRWLCLAPVLLTACALAPRADPLCVMSGATRTWIQGSLAAWDDVRERALRLPHAPPPALVFFDRYCVYRFGTGDGGTVTLRAGRDTLRGQGSAHGGSILLPGGLVLPARATALASLLPGDSATIVVLSLEDVWRSDPEHRGAGEDWPTYLRQALVHEMAHSRQLATLTPMLRIAGGRLGLVDVNDDIIQQRFDTVAGFRESVREETALLYRAASAVDAARKRELAAQALRLMRDRRTNAYGGADAPWARVEQLLLDMEGAAEWAVVAHLGLTTRMGAETRRNLVRGSRQFWSQEQGLALFTVLSDLVPDWSARIFSPNPPTAVELLEAATR